MKKMILVILLLMLATELLWTEAGKNEKQDVKSQNAIPLQEDKNDQQMKNEEKKKEVAQTIEVVRKKIKERKLNNKFHWDMRISTHQKDEVIALGQAGDLIAVPVLEEIVTNYPSVVARQNALKALEMLTNKDNSSIQVIKKALEDPNLLVRKQAAHILTKTKKEKEAIPILIEIAMIKNLDELDKDVLEDEWYYSEFYILHLYQQGQIEKATRLNPNIKTVSHEYIKNWGKQYVTLKENIIITSVEDLASFDAPEATKVVKEVSEKGPTERIRNKTKEILRKSETK